LREGGHLVSAQGAVREGAQAIDNLLHLLGSRRVGPKAIGRALIDVRDGCAGLSVAIGTLERELTDLLCAEEEASGIARSLLQKAVARVDLLSGELAAVKKVDVDARARLAVEVAVRRASSELDGILFLVDLLACAATPRLTQLDARDVLHGQAITPGRSSGPRMNAAGQAPERLSFVGDARLVGGLMLLSLSIVARASGGPPRVEASPLPDEQLEVRISGAPSPVEAGKGAPSEPSSVSELPAYAGAPEGAVVAQAVARLADIGLSIASSGQEIALVFGRTSAAGG